MFTEKNTLSPDRTKLLFHRASDETVRRHPGLATRVSVATEALLSEWKSESLSQSPELTSVSSFSNFVRRSLRSRHGEDRACAIEFLSTLGILAARADLRAAFDRTSAIYAVQ